MDKWDLCGQLKVDSNELKGRVCYGGLDLSSTTDITAFVLVFPPLEQSDTVSENSLDDKFIVLPYFWLPQDTLDLRVKRDHVPYDIWKRKGLIQTTEGNVVHYGAIEKFIENLGKEYNIQEIVFDRWGATHLVQDLEELGFKVIAFGQGYASMSPPTKELLKLTLERKIAHGGNEPLRWMVDNVYVKQDPAGNIKMDKEKSTEKIDGAVAMVMALSRALVSKPQESVYNNRGILFI